MNRNNQIRFEIIDEKIKNAMLTLLNQKKYDEIYVKDICDIADINRTTFYNHYKDINDLMIKMEQSLSNQFNSFFDYSTLHSKETLKDFFTFIKDNKDFYVVFINNNYDFAISKKRVSDYMHSQYITSEDDKNNSSIYHQIFFDAGILAISKLWIKTGMRESVEEIVDIVYNEYSNNYHFKSKQKTTS